ncbi:MAG: NADPH-dependent F420 reductase [Anaerolineae bacterium]|nr:NADPH-dependent F420 reductase [Anaerolineae bacterium]
MRIALIGTGNVGQALGVRWAQLGHEVIFVTRDPGSEKVQKILAEAGAGVRAMRVGEAAAAAPIIVLATPWNAVQSVIGSVPDWSGKIVIDATNPIAPGFQLAVSGDNSGAEQVARWAAGAQVVKAFNTTGAENMRDPIYNGEATTMFICGDSAEAKAITSQLAEALGFMVADVGPLTAARYLEPLAMVWIRLAIVQGRGRDIAFRLVQR